MVCQHGFPDDASTFDDLARGLAAAGYRVAAINLRGYAPSPTDGPFGLDELIADLLAVIDSLSPDRAIGFVGHDYGAQLAYPAMARAPHRFAATVLFAGAHPALITHNARRSLRQLWLSRYIVFFQLGALADRAVARHDFAYIDRLWARWSPGFTPSVGHLHHVKQTLRASMPAPIAMYRGGSFGVPAEPITVPTTYIGGADDGCALPLLADGQDALFVADYKGETWLDTGHFPHLEQPTRALDTVLDWFDHRLKTD